jgi:hypothetical protein
LLDLLEAQESQVLPHRILKRANVTVETFRIIASCVAVKSTAKPQN